MSPPSPASLSAPLPIDSFLPLIVEKLGQSKAVVVRAPPGAGKSTRVPGAILDSSLMGDGSLVMLEPRRVAARACASTIAALRGESLGQGVGYSVRFDDRTSAATRIHVVTEGILTRRMLFDPFLEGVACVVLDEFHERSIHSDLALAFLRELAGVREDLLLVVMSATMDTAAVSRYLGNAPVVDVETRQFPIEIAYAPASDDRPLHVRMAAGINTVLRRQGDGDLLAFLPGAREITLTRELLLKKELHGSPQILPFYGALPPGEQDRALGSGAERRVILATNIAETSITIPGVTAVVDSGLARSPSWDPGTGLNRLSTVQISKQSADQRAGRAGRTAPGYVLRMWMEHHHAARSPSDRPEIARVDPAEALLRVLAFQPGDPGKFPFFEPPTDAAISAGMILLRSLGALSRDETALSDLGKSLARLPLHPRLGTILLGAGANNGRRAALLVSVLSELEVFDRRHGLHGQGAHGKRDCDIGWRADLLEVTFDHQIEQQVGRLLRSPGLQNESGAPGDRTSDGALLMPGFPDRVCCRRGPGSPEGVMVGGRGVRLSERSGVRDGDLSVALNVHGGTHGERAVARVDAASAIDRKDLEGGFPWLWRTETVTDFDPGARRVIAQERTCFGDLVLERKPSRLDPDLAGPILAREALAHFDSVFRPDAAVSSLIARVTFASSSLTETTWPRVDRVGLEGMLPTLCEGLRSLDEVFRIDWEHAISSGMDWKARKLLEDEVPSRLKVPSGRWIELDYTPALRGETPVLPVRLQEVFGLVETPRIARGRVQLVMHLLAPNQRPVQVTSDLASFWKNTYAEVRKELRARYPKHHWPQDPISAQPTARARPRK